MGTPTGTQGSRCEISYQSLPVLLEMTLGRLYLSKVVGVPCLPSTEAAIHVPHPTLPTDLPPLWFMCTHRHTNKGGDICAGSSVLLIASGLVSLLPILRALLYCKMTDLRSKG